MFIAPTGARQPVTFSIMQKGGDHFQPAAKGRLSLSASSKTETISFSQQQKGDYLFQPAAKRRLSLSASSKMEASSFSQQQKGNYLFQQAAKGRLSCRAYVIREAIHMTAVLYVDEDRVEINFTVDCSFLISEVRASYQRQLAS